VTCTCAQHCGVTPLHPLPSRPQSYLRTLLSAHTTLQKRNWWPCTVGLGCKSIFFCHLSCTLAPHAHNKRAEHYLIDRLSGPLMLHASGRAAKLHTAHAMRHAGHTATLHSGRYCAAATNHTGTCILSSTAWHWPTALLRNQCSSSTANPVSRHQCHTQDNETATCISMLKPPAACVHALSSSMLQCVLQRCTKQNAAKSPVCIFLQRNIRYSRDHPV
jgi:hypothetical protein